MKKEISLSEINQSTLPFNFSGFVGIDLGNFKIGESQILVTLTKNTLETRSFTLHKWHSYPIFQISTTPVFLTIEFKLLIKEQHLKALNFDVIFLLPSQIPSISNVNIVNFPSHNA